MAVARTSGLDGRLTELRRARRLLRHVADPGKGFDQFGGGLQADIAGGRGG